MVPVNDDDDDDTQTSTLQVQQNTGKNIEDYNELVVVHSHTDTLQYWLALWNGENYLRFVFFFCAVVYSNFCTLPFFCSVLLTNGSIQYRHQSCFQPGHI